MRFLLLVAALLAALTVWAQPTPGTQPAPDVTKYYYLIGSCDAIVTATASAVKLPEPPKAASSMMGYNMRQATGAVTWKIDKTLLGTVDATTLKLDVSLYPNYQNDGGKMTVKGWQPALVDGQAYVVGLTKASTGWKMYAQVLPVAEAAAVSDAIAKFPLKATLVAPAGTPAIDSTATWTLKVKNVGTVPFELRMVYLSGMLAVKEADVWVGTQMVDDGTVLANEKNETQYRTVAPNEEASFPVTAKLTGPAGWQLFDKKYFPLQTLITAQVQFGFAGDPTKAAPQMARFQRFMVKSNAVPMTLTVPVKPVE